MTYKILPANNGTKRLIIGTQKSGDLFMHGLNTLPKIILAVVLLPHFVLHETGPRSVLYRYAPEIL